MFLRKGAVCLEKGKDVTIAGSLCEGCTCRRTKPRDQEEWSLQAGSVKSATLAIL